MPHVPIKLTAEQIKQELDRFSRDPFRIGLARALTNSPSDCDWQKFSSRQPERWVSAIVMLAKLAGYHEKVELLHARKSLADMSDADLLQLRAELDKQLENAGIQTVVEVQAIEDKSST